MPEQKEVSELLAVVNTLKAIAEKEDKIKCDECKTGRKLQCAECTEVHKTYRVAAKREMTKARRQIAENLDRPLRVECPHCKGEFSANKFTGKIVSIYRGRAFHG